VPDHKLVPNKISVVQTPAGTKFINLFAHITRGTMIVRNLNDAAIEPWLTLRTTLEKGPENGITRFEDDGAKKRHIAITCMHDQEPPPSDAAALPDSAPAFMTLDAYYGGGTTAVQRLFQFAVRPGDVGTFYVHFDFK
jgi:hypothetical protein